MIFHLLTLLNFLHYFPSVSNIWSLLSPSMLSRILSLVSAKAKALSSTTVSISYAYWRHHHHLYSRLSPLSLSTFGLGSTTVSISYAYWRHHHHLYSRLSPLSLSTFDSTFPSFVFGCIWVALVIGFNLEREKLDNLAWVWNLGI